MKGRPWKRLKGSLFFLLEMWILNVLLCSPSLADILENTEQEICAEVKHQISENLRLEIKNGEGDNQLNSEDDTNRTLDIIMSALNAIPDTENTKNISYNCLVQVSTNQTSKTKAKLEFISTLVGTNDGLINLMCNSNISSLEVVKFLLKTGSDLHTRYKTDETVFHFAAAKGYLNIVKWLINEKKMNISDSTNYIGNPLHYAVKNGQFDIVKWIIGNTDIDINQQNYNGETVLFLSSKYTDIAKYLIEVVKIDYNIRDNENSTFLHIVAKGGNLELTKLLVEDLKVDMNAREMENYTPLHLAYDHPDIVKYLLLQGADYNLTSNLQANILHFPVSRWRPETVKVILENCNLDINMQDYFGYTALHLGTELVQTVKYLVEIGKIDVNIINFVNDQTALHMASYEGHLDSVKYLVEKTNSNVNAQDGDGNTALHLATRHLEIVQYLVNKVDVNIKNNAGQNVLEKVKNQYDINNQNNDVKHSYDPYVPEIPDEVRHRNVHEWLVKNVNFTTTS